MTKEQNILNHWAKSHNNLSHLLSAQIPDQCEKILGGNIDDADKLIHETKTEFPSDDELVKDFKTKFVSNSFINQSLIDSYCVTNPEGVTECKIKITANDHTSYPDYLERLAALIENIIVFPISNGIFHVVHEQLDHYPNCSVSAQQVSPNIETISPLSPNIETMSPSVPIPSSQNSSCEAYKLKKNRSQYMSQKKNTGIRICYRCGD
ncbi:hypothetical protein E9993_23140, partial [Labilibacter sediminis]